MIKYNTEYFINNGVGSIKFFQIDKDIVAGIYFRGTITAKWVDGTLKGRFYDAIGDGDGLIEFVFTETGFNGKWKGGMEQGPMRGRWTGSLTKPEKNHGIGVVDTFNIKKSEDSKVDILFVIDNSGSMGSYQTNLSSNIELFINKFSNNSFVPDFKIGVCTTDSYNVRFFTKTDLTTNKVQFINNFKNAIMVGTSGSATEKGLEMAWLALNNNFSREDALVFINVISDELDDSPLSANDYVNKLKLIKGSNKVTVNAIHDSESSKHYSASKLTNGISANIKSNYGDLLTNIGQNVIDLMNTLPLSDIPNDVSKIKVKKNKVRIEDWKYNSNLNSIDFNSPLLPEDKIEVSFFIQDQNQ
jgi:hypothetical protein